MTVPDLDALADAVAERVFARLAARDDRPLLSVDEAGKRLGLSGRTVRDLIADGRLRSIKVADGARRVEPAAVDDYLERQRNGG